MLGHSHPERRSSGLGCVRKTAKTTVVSTRMGIDRANEATAVTLRAVSFLELNASNMSLDGSAQFASAFRSAEIVKFRKPNLTRVVLLWVSLALWVNAALADSTVTLSWYSDPEADVAGHKIVYGFESGVYPFVIEVGDVDSATITLPERDGPYYIAVVAYTHEWIDSVPSEEVVFAPPKLPRLQLTRQAGTGLLVSWSSVPGTGYRVVFKNQLDASAWNPVSKVIIAESAVTEWMAQIDPAQPGGFFAVEVFANPNEPPRLQMLITNRTDLKLAWNTIPGRGYRVLYKPTLDQGEWTPVSAVLLSEGASLEWVTQIEPGSPSGFYRLQVIDDPEAVPAARLDFGANRQMRLTWTAVPDRSYRIFHKRELNEPTWEPYSEVFTASDVSMNWDIPIDPTSPSGFFKVEMLPNF
jgi:hypothetical protein